MPQDTCQNGKTEKSDDIELSHAWEEAAISKHTSGRWTGKNSMKCQGKRMRLSQGWWEWRPTRPGGDGASQDPEVLALKSENT